jgi:hypothetical protein
MYVYVFLDGKMPHSLVALGKQGPAAFVSIILLLDVIWNSSFCEIPVNIVAVAVAAAAFAVVFPLDAMKSRLCGQVISPCVRFVFLKLVGLASRLA